MKLLTPETVLQYIRSHERIHGKAPALRSLAEEFDGRLLNVLRCLWALREKGAI